ncbi:hypothetical protein BT69DRAFT_1074750 [Atractiella rhizophila]|nr:hypothetical protein BT69DRAFT_1074750 [Atractiella rhizophila]
MAAPTPSQKLTIRPPPHVDFVQGFPGVPPLPITLQINSPKGQGQRLPAHLAGTVEIRPGPKGVKVSWLRIELKKVEIVPAGTEGGGRERHAELIGSGPQVLWRKGKAGAKADEEWETMMNRDFPFSIAIPEGLPPTVVLDAKGCGVFYELVASLATKPKKSFLSSSKQPLLIQTVPITLEKHDLHCAWPIYRPIPPETRNVILQEETGGVAMSFERKLTCYGPGDSVWVRLVFKSERVRPVRVRGIEVVISETITFRPMVTNSKGSKTLSTNAEQRTSLIVDSKVVPNQMLYRGEPFTIDIKGTVPPNHPRVTVRTAKHIQVAYQLAVRALLDGFENGKDRELIVDHLPTTISGFPFKQGALLLEKIGWDERLCAGRGMPESGNSSGQGISPGPSTSIPQEDKPLPTPANLSSGIATGSGDNRFANGSGSSRLSMAPNQLPTHQQSPPGSRLTTPTTVPQPNFGGFSETFATGVAAGFAGGPSGIGGASPNGRPLNSKSSSGQLSVNNVPHFCLPYFPSCRTRRFLFPGSSSLVQHRR